MRRAEVEIGEAADRVAPGCDVDRGIRPHSSVPEISTLGQFDVEFDSQAKLNVKLIKSLAAAEFVARHEDVTLVGQPGTGSSQLASALGMRVIQEECRVCSAAIPVPAAQPRATEADGTMEKVIDDPVEPDLLIVDELGVMPRDPALGDAFCCIDADRYEQPRLIVSSNENSEWWAEIFPSAVIAIAILDRLIRRAHFALAVGDSCRMKSVGHSKAAKAQLGRSVTETATKTETESVRQPVIPWRHVA